MGTHPIFESDFDCLTETETQNACQARHQSRHASTLPRNDAQVPGPIGQADVERASRCQDGASECPKTKECQSIYSSSSSSSSAASGASTWRKMVLLSQQRSVFQYA